MADGAVLAGRVDALQHDQHGVLAFRPDPLLERRQAVEPRLDDRRRIVLGVPEGLAGIDLRQPHLVAGRHEEAVAERAAGEGFGHADQSSVAPRPYDRLTRCGRCGDVAAAAFDTSTPDQEVNVSNQNLRPVRLAACLVTAAVVLAACGATASSGPVGDAGAAAAGVTVPTWPATATPDWSYLPDGSSVPADATTQPTSTALAAAGGGGGNGGSGSSSNASGGGLSAATDAQLEQLLQEANQALDAANAAASDDSAQSGQDEGAIP